MIEGVFDPAEWLIVVNPASGAGRATRFRPRLLAALGPAGVAFRCVECAGAGDAGRLAASAVAEGCRRLLALGGDGTLNELVNGLLESGVDPRACLVAAAAGGTGNDWSREMQVPDDPDRLAACMARAHARPADLGIADGGRGRRAAFHNVAGSGLDAEVIARTPRRGPRAAAYLLGVAHALARHRAACFEVLADGSELHGTYLLALVSVGPRCGGGMRLTPGAIVDDGWLDLLLLDPLSPAAALACLPRLFNGRLAGDPAFHVTRCRQATIRSDPPSGVQLDGQLFGTTPVTISILPGALRALDCRPAARTGGSGFSGTPRGSCRACRLPGRAARRARS